MRRRERIDDAWTYLGLLAILLFFGLPLVWLISLSFRNAQEILVSTVNPIPDNPTFSNYSEVLSSAQFPRFLLNSAILSAIGAFGALAVAAPAAFAFSRVDFRGRRALLLSVLALQMISPLVVAFPLYRYFASLGILNSLPATGLVYIAILMPLATWMLKGFFDGIPKDLDEAAMIDGASRLTAFFRVVLPVARSGLTAVFVIMALLAWAEFVVPYILLTGPSRLPISVGILNFQGTYATNATGILAAGSVIAVLPAILLFVALQRFIVGAFIAGALKG
jgi:multiple sugar transport system permease protein